MPNSETTPYLSFVVASRNDNHGGDMLRRMQLFVKGLIFQCNSFQLESELIIVEWNPVEGALSLKEVLPENHKDDYLRIRYIVVPNEFHRSFDYSDRIPLFQMIAKNVGIRRALGKFVLCTNIDLLFSNSLFAFLAKKDLHQNCFYRANRCDVPSEIKEEWPNEKQLDFCEKNIKKRLGKNTNYANFSSTSGFLFNSKELLPLLTVLSRIKSIYAVGLMDRFNELDFEACGDFTLMSKENWLAIQGYPELEMYSIHIDSMALFAASALGFKQIILKPACCTYHLEHSGGWEFEDPIEKVRFVSKKPMLDWWTVREAGLHLMRNKTKYELNKTNWGLADQTLSEVSGQNHTIDSINTKHS